MTKQEVAARFDIYKLGENERVESFDCGDADLNDFILKNGFVPLNDEDADEPTRLLYFDLNDLDEE